MNNRQQNRTKTFNQAYISEHPTHLTVTSAPTVPTFNALTLLVGCQEWHADRKICVSIIFKSSLLEHV